MKENSRKDNVLKKEQKKRSQREKNQPDAVYCKKSAMYMICTIQSQE